MQQRLFPQAPGYSRLFPVTGGNAERNCATATPPAILRHGCKTQILRPVGIPERKPAKKARERATRERRHGAGNRGQYG